MGGVLAFWGNLDGHGDATDPFARHFGQAFASEEHEPPSSDPSLLRPEASPMVSDSLAKTLSFPQTSADIHRLPLHGIVVLLARFSRLSRSISKYATASAGYFFFLFDEAFFWAGVLKMPAAVLLSCLCFPLNTPHPQLFAFLLGAIGIF